MSIATMKLAADKLEIGLAYPGMRLYHDDIRAAITALRTAIAEAEKQEPVVWLTKELMADYLDMIAEAIADNKSETLRHKAYWMRKGDV